MKAQVSERLITEPYGALPEVAQQIRYETLQDILRLIKNCQGVEQCEYKVECGSMNNEEVSAVLDGQIEWEEGNKREINFLVAP